MKYKRKKATFGVLAPNIQRGGMAIPLGNNLYWMRGRKHKTGGIDIGKDLEVENNEVMQMLPNETRVFSSVKMLGGNSPAELVASGINPNMVFNAQELYKKINRIRDDGSRYKRGGRKIAKYGYDENGNPIYGLTREYPIPLNNINVIGNLDTLRKAKALFRDDEQRRIMLDQEYDIYRNNVSRGFLNYIDEFYDNDEFKQSKLDGTLDKHALERLEQGIEIEPTVDQVIDNLYYLRNKTNDVYVTPYNYKIDELPESNEVKRNDEAYRSWYSGNNKNDIDTIFVPRVDNFNNLNIMDNYISEFSHHLQSQPGNEILMGKKVDKFYEDEYGNYKPVQEVYDIPGYVEFNAHKIIEPLLRNFIYSNYDGDKELRDNTYNAIMNIMKKQANEVKIKKYGGKMNLQNIGNPLARYGKRKVYKTIKGAKAHWEINERGEKVLVPNNTIEYGGGQFSGSGAGASWGDEETVEPKTNQLDVIPLPESRTFNEAYSAARREKKKTFMFNGKEYSTAYSPNVQNWRQAGDSRVEVTGYGLGARWRKPLGGIVRFDGAGRDRLAYIPSTGSSKQDMKCGGRIKALVGTQYTNPLLRYIVDRNGNWGYNGIGYGVPNASHIGMYQDEADQYIPESSKGEIVNGDENITIIPTDDNSTTPILVDTRIHRTNGTNVYSTKRSTPVLPQLSTVPPAIKDLKTINFNRLTPTIGKGISSYLDIVNDITKGESDWQGYAAAGVNALGSVINSLIMNNSLRKQRPPVRPIPKIAQKLKTKYNINPQLSENREATAQAIRDVARNTASSQVGRNLINSLGLQRAIADNKLFAEKENKETELINKDIVNRQSVDYENVDTYNKWLEARNDFYNNRSLLRAQNWATLVNGISSQIGAGLGNIGASRRYRNNVLLAMLSYIKATGNG